MIFLGLQTTWWCKKDICRCSWAEALHQMAQLCHFQPIQVHRCSVSVIKDRLLLVPHARMPFWCLSVQIWGNFFIPFRFDAASRKQARVESLGLFERFVVGAIRPNATLPPIYITCLHLNHVAEPTRLSGMTTHSPYLVIIIFSFWLPCSSEGLFLGTI